MKTPEQINDLRKRVLAGEDVSPDEYREIIQAYRAQRLGAVTASAPKTVARAASPNPQLRSTLTRSWPASAWARVPRSRPCPANFHSQSFWTIPPYRPLKNAPWIGTTPPSATSPTRGRISTFTPAGPTRQGWKPLAGPSTTVGKTRKRP